MESLASIQTCGISLLNLITISFRTPATDLKKKHNTLLRNWWICVSYFRLSQTHQQLVDLPAAILASRLLDPSLSYSLRFLCSPRLFIAV